MHWWLKASNVQPRSVETYSPCQTMRRADILLRQKSYVPTYVLLNFKYFKRKKNEVIEIRFSLGRLIETAFILI